MSEPGPRADRELVNSRTGLSHREEGAREVEHAMASVAFSARVLAAQEVARC